LFAETLEGAYLRDGIREVRSILDDCPINHLVGRSGSARLGPAPMTSTTIHSDLPASGCQ